MNSLERAEQICQKLESAGVRATIDPSALSLPGVLVHLPDRANDLNCGVSVTWHLSALVPVPAGWDRTAWRLMEELVSVVESCFEISSSRATPFQRPGAPQLVNFPSYEMTFMEAID